MSDLFKVYKDRHAEAKREYLQYPHEERPFNAKAKEALEEMCHALDLNTAIVLDRALDQYERNPPPNMSEYARAN